MAENIEISGLYGGTAVPVSVDASGNVNVKIASGSSSTNPSIGTNGTTAPTSSTQIAYINGSSNLTPVSSSNALPITGTISTNADGSVTGSASASKSLLIGGIYNNSLPTLSTGNQAGVQLDSSGRLLVVLATAIPAGTNAIGSVTLATTTTGGSSAFSYISAAGSNQDQQAVKSSAGTIYGIQAYNNSNTVAYLKIYNVSAPTSSNVPILRFLVPGNSNGAGTNISFTALGISFSTAIGVRLTTGIADADTGTVITGTILLNIEYA